ncbi:hypothetical protein AKJ16_DCAP14224 [Drosera capensis]
MVKFPHWLLQPGLVPVRLWLLPYKEEFVVEVKLNGIGGRDFGRHHQGQGGRDEADDIGEDVRPDACSGIGCCRTSLPRGSTLFYISSSHVSVDETVLLAYGGCN